MANLIGNEITSNRPLQTQVYQATHDREGNLLPYMVRSFISFTYGGKAIEDFGLIITTDDRLSKNIYSNFEDITDTQDTFDGQLYWGTHLTNNELALTLSTDGMTQLQLDNFRNWFQPGVERELILAEHPNRGILARISEPPKLNVLPFEQPITFQIGSTYSTSTTLYKGSIDITFTMDEPCWYSLITYMPSNINKNTMEYSENGISTLNDKDMLKVIYEDGIPHVNAFSYDSTSMQQVILGGEVIVALGDSSILAPSGINENDEDNRARYAMVGRRLGTSITGESNGIKEIYANKPGYLFYAGTTKCYPWYQFTTLLFNDNGNLKMPRSDGYSFLQVGESKFEFSAPRLFIDYNQALDILNQNSTLQEKKDLINSTIHDYYLRAWVIKIIDYLKTGDVADTNQNHKALMRKFFRPYIQNESTAKGIFYFNSKTGEAIGKFDINIGTPTLSVEDTSEYLTIEQSVGDMIRSNFLFIEGKDSLNSNGTFNKNLCHKITTNEVLYDVWIGYNNMYL